MKVGDFGGIGFPQFPPLFNTNIFYSRFEGGLEDWMEGMLEI